MKQLTKLIFILPLIALLSSCGLRTRELYAGDGYNDPNFGKNYYRYYDSQIDPDNPHNNIVATLNKDITDADYVVNKYGDAKNKTFEGTENKVFKGTDLEYFYDSKPNESKNGKVYGPTYKMSSIDESFKYGIVSKLFDGQMFCHGGFELVRMQADERGFGHLFDKEIASLNDDAYFAINFKAASNINAEKRASVPEHLSSVNLHISFYIKDGNNYTQIKTTRNFTNLPTNRSDGAFDEEVMLNYQFYAFSLKEFKNEFDLKRCAGFSISYELLEDSEASKWDNYCYSLLFYEMMFVGVTFR